MRIWTAAFILACAARPAAAGEAPAQDPAASKALARSYAELGRSQRLAGQLLQAEESLAKAVKLDPTDYDAVFQLGLVYRTKQNYPRAAAALETALAIRQDDPALYVLLSEVYRWQNKTEEAKRLFAIGKEFCPKCSDLYVNVGYTELDAGREADALRIFKELQKQNPSNFLAYHHLGRYFRRLGRYAEAERSFKKTLAILDKTPERTDDRVHALINLGDVYIKQKKLTEGEAVLQEAQALVIAHKADKHVLAPMFSLTEFYLDEGRYADAATVYGQTEEALKALPGKQTSLAYAAVGLADVRRLQKNLAEAKGLYAGVLRNEAADSYTRAYALTGLAMIEEQRGGADQSRSLIRQALRELEEARSPGRLADVLLRIGDFEKQRLRFGDAESRYLQALDILEKRTPHIEYTVKALTALTEAYQAERKDGEIRALYRRFAPILRKIPDAAKTATVLEHEDR